MAFASNILALVHHDRSFSFRYLQDVLTRMEYVDPKMLEEPVPQEPRPIAETSLMVVSTLSALNEMAAKCRLAGEIAVGPYHYTFNIVLSCFEIIEGKIWHWDATHYYFSVLIIASC